MATDGARELSTFTAQDADGIFGGETCDHQMSPRAVATSYFEVRDCVGQSYCILRMK